MALLSHEQMTMIATLSLEQQDQVFAMMRQRFGGNKNGNGARPSPKAKAKAKARASTPPKTGATRGPRCANCGGNHATRECTKDVVADASRICFNCLKPGHKAQDCPEKKGKGRAKLVESSANGVAAAPRLLMVGTDEDGFETVIRRRSERVPGKFTLADMPIRPGRTTQRASKDLISKDLRRQRDFNRYSGLGGDDADDHGGDTCIALPKPLRHDKTEHTK